MKITISPPILLETDYSLFSPVDQTHVPGFDVQPQSKHSSIISSPKPFEYQQCPSLQQNATEMLSGSLTLVWEDMAQILEVDPSGTYDPKPFAGMGIAWGGLCVLVLSYRPRAIVTARTSGLGGGYRSSLRLQ